jgi:outer membrane protein assembly factor BamB
VLRSAPVRALAVALACGVLSTGCRAVPLTTQPFDRRGPELSPQAVFRVDWQVKLVGPQLWESLPREAAAPAVDPDTGRIIALTRDGFVRSLNPDGRIEWSFQTRGIFKAGALVHEGVVYVPGGDGHLYALRARNGEELWRYDAGEELATVPLVAGGRVYVASQGNTLFAVNRENGQWLWQHRRDLPSGFMVQGVARPTLSMGTLYAGFSDGYLVALDPETGQPRWEKPLSAPGNEFLDVDTQPQVDDAGRLYAASYKSGVFALDPDSGSVLWTVPWAGTTALVQRGDVLFTTGDRGVNAWLADNGRALWSLPMKDRAAQLPLFARGMLVVPANDALVFVDPATGLQRLAWDPGQGVSAAPVQAGQRLYVLSNLGFLYALRLTGSGG